MAIDWTKNWTSADDGTIVDGSDLKNLQDDIDAALGSGSFSGLSATSTFVAGDLSSVGILAIGHSLTIAAPNVSVYDNNDNLIWPDEINLVDTDNLTVDLASYGTISGTWSYRVSA